VLYVVVRAASAAPSGDSGGEGGAGGARVPTGLLKDLPQSDGLLHLTTPDHLKIVHCYRQSCLSCWQMSLTDVTLTWSGLVTGVVSTHIPLSIWYKRKCLAEPKTRSWSVLRCGQARINGGYLSSDILIQARGLYARSVTILRVGKLKGDSCCYLVDLWWLAPQWMSDMIGQA